MSYRLSFLFDFIYLTRYEVGASRFGGHVRTISDSWQCAHILMPLLSEVPALVPYCSELSTVSPDAELMWGKSPETSLPCTAPCRPVRLPASSLEVPAASLLHAISRILGEVYLPNMVLLHPVGPLDCDTLFGALDFFVLKLYFAL